MCAKSSRLIPDRVGIKLSLVLFGVPALALWLATALVLPALVSRGWGPLSAWFLAGMLALGPLLAAALAGAWMALPAASFPAILEHLRVRRLRAHDWRIAGLALAVTIAAMAALQLFNALVWPQLPPHPPFITVQALEPTRYYLFALWLPFFAVNIVGEELWWRGFIQPRQEPVFGASTWVVQGLLHGAFHFSFGWNRTGQRNSLKGTTGAKIRDDWKWRPRGIRPHRCRHSGCSHAHDAKLQKDGVLMGIAGTPALHIRVQELFGLTQHPSIAGGKLPLTLNLLSPVQRPIQITRDLPSFWKGSWAAVKAEMKAAIRGTARRSCLGTSHRAGQAARDVSA